MENVRQLQGRLPLASVSRTVNLTKPDYKFQAARFLRWRKRVRHKNSRCRDVAPQTLTKSGLESFSCLHSTSASQQTALDPAAIRALTLARFASDTFDAQYVVSVFKIAG